MIPVFPSPPTQSRPLPNEWFQPKSARREIPVGGFHRRGSVTGQLEAADPDRSSGALEFALAIAAVAGA